MLDWFLFWSSSLQHFIAKFLFWNIIYSSFVVFYRKEGDSNISEIIGKDLKTLWLYLAIYT